MTPYDLLIIGGGPAALAAAVYAQAKHLHILLIYEEFGGKTVWHDGGNSRDAGRELPGNEVVGLLARQVKDQLIATVHDRVETLSKDGEMFHVTTRHHGQFASRTVLVATGATPQRLDLPGVQHLLSQDIGYSLTTFAHTMARQRIAVIGITQRTLRGIAEILDSAEHIYLITAAATLPDLPFLDVLRQAPHLEIMADTVVRDVIGFSTVKSMLVKSGAVIKSLAVDRVFIDLGLTPNTQFLSLPVLDPDGFVIVDEVNATPVAGLFAAGDATTSRVGEQVLIAIGAGACAASSAYESILAGRLAALAPMPPCL